jgi:aminoglycoside phosphotransferase (APT) family kinase protein
MGETAIVEALRPLWPPPTSRTALLHGDFWPGNVLWTGDRITGVIDWADAVVGDPLADVSTLRLDLRFDAGPTASAAFTSRYAALTGVDLGPLPVWDLCTALRPCGYVSLWAADLLNLGGGVTAASMRADHAAFTAEAFAALGLGAFSPRG